MASTNAPQATTLRRVGHALVLAFAFLIAQGSVVYTCYWIGHTEGIRESDGILGDLPDTLDGYHILISVFLGTCVVGLWLRRLWGLIISTLALVSVLSIYGYWHLKTLSYLRELQSNYLVYRRVQQEAGWFHGATKWDFVLLALVAVLLSWLLFTLVKTTLERRRTSARG